MDDRLKRVVEECIADLKKSQWAGFDGAAYAAGYLHEYPELRRLLLIIADMEKE